jgi:hypothetical protein
MAESCVSATEGEANNAAAAGAAAQASQPIAEIRGRRSILSTNRGNAFPMTYIAQADRPFPAPMEGNMEGAFFERILDGGATSFYLIVRPRRYLTARDRELIDQGHFSLEELHPEVPRLGRTPAPDSLWLYELESFKVAREHHSDSDAFNDNATDYSSQIFDDVASLLDHCEKEFGVSASDFKNSAATNYP